MATITTTIHDLQRRFAESGSDSPRLDAELLIGHVLGLDRTRLLAMLHEPLLDNTARDIEVLAKRRLAGEPIAYILGHREFFGHELVVSPAVLTPRPETELLVEWALHWLESHPKARVVDVGTGSGAIAIAVAINTPATVSIIALDLSKDALAIAQSNAKRLCPGRIAFHQGDLLAGETDQFDLILANLPYLRPDQIADNRDLAAEPRMALHGGTGGLALIRQLIDQIPDFLTAHGAICLEIDPSQSGQVSQALGASLPGARVAVHQDLAGLDRLVSAVRL